MYKLCYLQGKKERAKLDFSGINYKDFVFYKIIFSTLLVYRAFSIYKVYQKESSDFKLLSESIY